MAVLPVVFVNCDGLLPTVMSAVQGSGVGCDKPDWSCISEKLVDVPSPLAGQVLLEMRGASVNPINVDLVEPECAHEMGCSGGTIGNDGAGVVVAVGSDCPDFKVGDAVWGFISGSYAQYAVASCGGIGLKPENLDFVSAGTIPVVGGTAWQCLESAGLVPAAAKSNLTVVITSGQGGTGYMAVQLAKAMGAGRVITAGSGDGINFVKKLGADIVVDYHQQTLADYLEDDSVDIVFDNLGVQGTADKMMHAIRPGGFFSVLMGGNGGAISENPKEGVNQACCQCFSENLKEGVNQVSLGFASFGSELDSLKSMFEHDIISARVMDPVYTLSEVPDAFTRSRSHGVLGKIAIVPSVVTLV